MKRLLAIIFISTALVSCDKEKNVFTNDFAAAAFILASPNAPTVHVFVDTLRKTTSSLAYRGGSPYQSITPGTHNIQLRNSVNLQTQYLNLPSESFTTNTASTYLVYDTLVGTGNLKVARLTDTLTLPETNLIKVRFVHLAVKGGAYDVTFLRTSNPVADSVTITNQAYIGSAPSAAALLTLSGFYRIPLGAYTVKLKTPGTQTVLTTAAIASTVSGIFTFYAAGTAPGSTALTLTAFRHYP